MTTDTQSSRRPSWRFVLQLLVLVTFLVMAVGATGVFALDICPVCPSPYRVVEPPPQLPQELEKDKQSGGQSSSSPKSP